MDRPTIPTPPEPDARRRFSCPDGGAVIDPAAIWARMSQHDQTLREILATQQETNRLLGEIMAEVQLDQSVIDAAATAIEPLLSAVTTFLADEPANIPPATLTLFNQAL